MTRLPRLLALVTLLFAPLGLAACGGTSEPPATTASAPATTAAQRPPAAPYVPTGEGLHVTSVTKSGNVYEVVLNGVVRIPNVRVIDGAKGKFLGFPQREAEGRHFDYVYVDSAVGSGLVREVEEGHGVPGNMGFVITKAEVHPFSSGKGGFVTFLLNDGAVKLYSWRLTDGPRGMWLAAPSEKVGNDYQDVLTVPDRDFKKALENAAIEAFQRG